MLMPKRVKHRKVMRGRMSGVAKGGYNVAFGEYGLATQEPARLKELLATLDRLAEREGAERAAIALAFVLCHPASPVPLIGTQQPERIKAAVAALHVRLERADLYDIIEASEGVPLP